MAPPVSRRTASWTRIVEWTSGGSWPTRARRGTSWRGHVNTSGPQPSRSPTIQPCARSSSACSGTPASGCWASASSARTCNPKLRSRSWQPADLCRRFLQFSGGRAADCSHGELATPRRTRRTDGVLVERSRREELACAYTRSNPWPHAPQRQTCRRLTRSSPTRTPGMPNANRTITTKLPTPAATSPPAPVAATAAL
jgi:hypothetical protein